MSFWSWMKGLFGKREKPEPPIVSLVLLLREERYLDAAILQQLASKAWDIEFEDSEQAEEFVIPVHDDSNYMIRAKGQMFLVNNYSRPYVEDLEQACAEITELRLRQALLDHTAWLSVDRFGPSDMTDEVAFRWIGRLLAELVDDDCTAIFCPATSQGCVYDSSLDDALRSRNPLQIFDSLQSSPVVEVKSDDPRMVQAVREARDRWPEFVKAFESRQSSDIFSVKAPLSDGVNTEFMWLSVGAIENGIIFGRLDNDPVSITTIKCGDRVRVSVTELNDWLYVQGAERQGGFTVAVLSKLYREGK